MVGLTLYIPGVRPEVVFPSVERDLLPLMAQYSSPLWNVLPEIPRRGFELLRVGRVAFRLSWSWLAAS